MITFCFALRRERAVVCICVGTAVNERSGRTAASTSLWKHFEGARDFIRFCDVSTTFYVISGFLSSLPQKASKSPPCRADLDFEEALEGAIPFMQNIRSVWYVNIAVCGMENGGFFVRTKRGKSDVWGRPRGLRLRH